MGIIAALITFGILVTVHEFGHFICAKWTGMQVDEFAIGFGPEIWSKRKGETLYSLRCVPLGGYNKIAGMDPGDPVTERGYKSKTIPQRLLVVVAGATMNFLLPVVLYAGISMFAGVDTVVDKPVLGLVQEDKVAYEAGLRAGDKLLSINGYTLTTWNDVVQQVKANGERPMKLVAQRGDKVTTYTLHPKVSPELKRVLIGISPVIENHRCGPFSAIWVGISRTWQTMTLMVNGLYQIIIGSAPADLSGPIGVAMAAGEVAAKGTAALLHFIAFLSINLGIINLLPLPALDGGYVVILALEAIRGKSLPDKAMEYIQYAGVGIIAFITLFATYKDLLRLG